MLPKISHCFGGVIADEYNKTDVFASNSKEGTAMRREMSSSLVGLLLREVLVEVEVEVLVVEVLVVVGGGSVVGAEVVAAVAH